MTTHHFFDADHYLLYLDGDPVPTTLADFEGGGVTAGVATEDPGTEGDPPLKNISSLTFEPMMIRTGISMGNSLYQWIRTTMDQTDIRRNGYIVSVNRDRRATSFRHFNNAVLSAITVPALDTGSKDSAFFTLVLEPREILYKEGDASNRADAIDTAGKKWSCSAFRLQLGDLPCTDVARIESFTIRQVLSPEVKGDFRVSTRMKSSLEIPNLKITFAPTMIQPWAAWFNEFVIQGRNSQKEELSGTIGFLDSAGNETGSIGLSQIGIFALSRKRKQEEANNRISHYVAELYVEKMTFNLAARQ